MMSFYLKEITNEHVHILDKMLQLYTHDINEYFDYSVVLDNNGRYCIYSVEKLLSDGWGYFIIANFEYAGFILLNNQTKSSKGVFISEFYILPRYRHGFFYKNVIFSLFTELKGHVEYRVLKKNRRAYALFEYITKKLVSKVEKTEEFENGSEYFRFTMHTENILVDILRYKMYVKPHSHNSHNSHNLISEVSN